MAIAVVVDATVAAVVVVALNGTTVLHLVVVAVETVTMEALTLAVPKLRATSLYWPPVTIADRKQLEAPNIAAADRTDTCRNRLRVVYPAHHHPCPQNPNLLVFCLVNP